MQDDLYFIPMIARAFEAPDQRAALSVALRRICEMGRQERYRAGFCLFMVFLRLASSRQGQREAADFETSNVWPDVGDACIALSIVRDGVLLAACTFEPGCGPKTIAGLTPGCYRIELQTGRVLWQGHLTEQDVRFEVVPMAAGGGAARASRCHRAIHDDGVLVVRIHPGLEAGMLELELARPRREI